VKVYGDSTKVSTYVILENVDAAHRLDTVAIQQPQDMECDLLPGGTKVPRISLRGWSNHHFQVATRTWRRTSLDFFSSTREAGFKEKDTTLLKPKPSALRRTPELGRFTNCRRTMNRWLVTVRSGGKPPARWGCGLFG